MNSAAFSCDCSQAGDAFPHFWEHTVGSGHATLALRSDYQGQLKRAHAELGFRYVRFHGILNDDMGTFLIYADKPYYSFFNADQIFDFLLSIGMKPFVELSFMPTGLSSGDKIAFHYRANVTMPRDLALWSTLITKLASHWVERYGIDEVRQWFFEVWNEPNLDAFGSGKFEDYQTLYRATSTALKAAHGDIKVGGPVTAANAWIPEFLDFTARENLPVDFVSTHHYPTDAFGKPGDDTVTQLAESRRSVLREETSAAKAQARGLPLYYTEWSSSSNPRDVLHDQPYAACFITKTIMENTGLVEAYSWWTFSDIFEENYFPSEPFQGGFGLLSIHGIAKPSYRAFQLLHALGDRLYKIAGSHPTVDLWVVKGKDGLTVLITNFGLPRAPIETEQVSVRLERLQGTPTRARIARIDDGHCYARATWEAMGSPNYLSPSEVQQLARVSELRWEDLSFANEAGALVFNVDVPPLGVASIEISF